MQAIRQVIDVVGTTVTIPIPQQFYKHKVEVIVLPYEEVTVSPKTWPTGFLDKFAGCMQDDPLSRSPQGTYEFRTNIK